MIQRIQVRAMTEKIWEGTQVEKIKDGRFAKFANQCKDAALNLLGHHAKNTKHSRNIPDQKLTLPSD